MSKLNFPQWVPQIPKDSRILIAGATGGLGTALTEMLLKGPHCQIGAHGGSREFPQIDPRITPIQMALNSGDDCERLVQEFVELAGGIDALVILSGAIHYSGHWKDMPTEDWQRDIDVNLNQPFYLARAATAHMKNQGSGGRILLTGTESSIHGGSALSFPYAVAKQGTECLVQGLAREGASHNILVNGVRFGYITSGFHQRWHGKTEHDLKERANLVPLKRGGHVDEAAALMIYLLSGWAQFITGQMIPLTGGDWL